MSTNVIQVAIDRAVAKEREDICTYIAWASMESGEEAKRLDAAGDETMSEALLTISGALLTVARTIARGAHRK